jgi:hypothetical protein
MRRLIVILATLGLLIGAAVLVPTAASASSPVEYVLL